MSTLVLEAAKNVDALSDFGYCTQMVVAFAEGDVVFVAVIVVAAVQTNEPLLVVDEPDPESESKLEDAVVQVVVAVAGTGVALPYSV